MNFNNFWSNVSHLSIGDLVPQEIKKAISEALKQVERKKEVLQS